MLADVALGEPTGSNPVARPIAREFEAIFADQHPRALRLAYAMTGDQTIAEDAVAEAFARTYRRWKQGGIADPDAYVRRAVVNEVRSFWRRRDVRQRHAARERNSEITVGFGEQRIVDADVLQTALLTMSPRARAVVLLRVVDDLSERETADTLGISVGSVKSYLSRGLERLRQALAATEGDLDA